MPQKRLIRVTKQQLAEAIGDSFDYLDFEDDTTPFDGTTNISVTGKTSDTEDGMPITTDDVANMVHQQRYLPYQRRFGGCTVKSGLHEADQNNDGVDDFYNHDELDTLSNGDNKDDITRVPQTVLQKIDLLMDAIKNLNPKQRGMVLNKIVEAFGVTEIPSQWRKELSLKMLGNPQPDKPSQIK